MLSMTFWLLSVLVPLQILLGDQHGLNTLEHQPAKLAAIEAHWTTGSRAPLVLFAIPDDTAETNRYAVEVPDLGSLILTHDLDGTVRGLKDWPADQRPTVAIPFFAFRIMVGIGLLMLAMIVVSWWLRLAGVCSIRPGSWCLPDRLAARVCRRAGGLGDDRNRAPALDGLRIVAHRRFRDLRR